MPWRRWVWENTENQRGNRKRGGDGARKERFHCGAEHVPSGPHPELLVFSAARRQPQREPHLSETLRIEKYLSSGSYLSAFTPWHTHMLVLPLQQNKLPSRKQYALADGLASWKWNAPQPTASRRRGLIKRGCCSCWCLPSLNVFCPAVILSLSATKYEHSCRKNRLPAYCHWHNVWLKSSHNEKCLVVKSGLFWFHLSCDGENKIRCLGAATFAWKRSLLLYATWEATRHRWWPLWRIMNTPTLPRRPGECSYTHTP